MKRTVKWMLIALMLSTALCATSAIAVSRAVGSAEGWLDRVEAAVRSEDLAGARDLLERMDRDWRQREHLLELVTVHDALTEVEAGIRDAALCLEGGDVLESLRATAALCACLECMRMTEAARWMNLF